MDESTIFSDYSIVTQNFTSSYGKSYQLKKKSTNEQYVCKIIDKSLLGENGFNSCLPYI